jgi:hypothetical protein
MDCAIAGAAMAVPPSATVDFRNVRRFIESSLKTHPPVVE